MRAPQHVNRPHGVAIPVEKDANGDIKCLACGRYRPRNEYGHDSSKSHGLHSRKCYACGFGPMLARRKAERAAAAEARRLAAEQPVAQPSPVQADAEMGPVCGVRPMMADVETDLPPRLVLRGPWGGVEEMAIFPRGVLSWPRVSTEEGRS